MFIAFNNVCIWTFARSNLVYHFHMKTFQINKLHPYSFGKHVAPGTTEPQTKTQGSSFHPNDYLSFPFHARNVMCNSVLFIKSAYDINSAHECISFKIHRNIYSECISIVPFSHLFISESKQQRAASGMAKLERKCEKKKKKNIELNCRCYFLFLIRCFFFFSSPSAFC